MNETPSVSVGLPTYNGSKYLRQAVESLLAQSYSDFELIICDNCSTDDTEAISREYAERDPRVRYYSNSENLGAAANFNRVLELARAPLFAWANDDDLWDPRYLEHCHRVLEARPEVVCVFARSIKIGPGGQDIEAHVSDLKLDGATPARRLKRYYDLFRDITRRGGWSSGATEGLWMPVYGLMRTERLRRTGQIGPYISSDTVLIEEMLLQGPIVELPDTLFFKREHPNRSLQAYLSYDKRIEWFSGKGNWTMMFPRWRILVERLRAAWRARIPLNQRFLCLAVIARYYLTSTLGLGLGKELIVNARRYLVRFGSLKKAPEQW